MIPFMSARGLLAVFFTLLLVLAGADVAFGAEITPCFAGLLQDVVGSRTRIIQFSVVGVILAICILIKR